MNEINTTNKRPLSKAEISKQKEFFKKKCAKEGLFAICAAQDFIATQYFLKAVSREEADQFLKDVCNN